MDQMLSRPVQPATYTRLTKTVLVHNLVFRLVTPMLHHYKVPPTVRIGPQGTDATFVTGVNTAGTVRVNNLANLEALLNIIANGMEILGIAWGGPTMIMGFMAHGCWNTRCYEESSLRSSRCHRWTGNTRLHQPARSISPRRQLVQLIAKQSNQYCEEQLVFGLHSQVVSALSPEEPDLRGALTWLLELLYVLRVFLSALFSFLFLLI
ncbi:MAG: hypothetical protein U0103_06920 [Candidatus Obscuribacterales bacterium]